MRRVLDVFLPNRRRAAERTVHEEQAVRRGQAAPSTIEGSRARRRAAGDAAGLRSTPMPNGERLTPEQMASMAAMPPDAVVTSDDTGVGE